MKKLKMLGLIMAATIMCEGEILLQAERLRTGTAGD